MKQLTWRAVIVGMLLGSILSLTNLYANLKMGWSFGVALTAGIISFALWNAFVRLGISKSPMTILENTCMQSAASSAGYSTGGTLTSAVAALLLLTGQHMPLGTTFAWIFFIAVLGVTMAIPMKRQMINIEQIRFPDSIATAETLKVLYSEGKKAAEAIRAMGVTIEDTAGEFVGASSMEEQIRALFAPGGLQNGGGTGEGQDHGDGGNAAQGGQNAPGEGENGQGGGVPAMLTGHLDAAKLERMKKEDLLDLAAKLGVDVSAAKNQQERAQLIAAAEVQAHATDPENGGGAL